MTRRPGRAVLRARFGQLGVFAGVGTAALVVQVGLLNLIVGHGLGPLPANAIAVVLSTTVAYIGNRYLTFGRRGHRRVPAEALAFVVVNAVTFGLAELLLASSYLIGAQHDRTVINVLTLSGIAIGTVLRFAGYRRFVFAGPNVPAPTPRVGTSRPEHR